jgi:predicted anti-sigma-YlaC factor YlaD
MKCKDFNNQLAMLQEMGKIPVEMQEHIKQCVSCSEVFEKTQQLFNFVAEERSQKVSPFVTTRIMGQIERAEKPSWFTRPSLVAVMSVVVLVLGFFSASLFSNSGSSTLANSTEIIATDYFFTENPGSQLEDIWLNSYSYE